MKKFLNFPLPIPVNLTEDIDADTFVLPPNVSSLSYSYGSMFELDNIALTSDVPSIINYNILSHKFRNTNKRKKRRVNNFLY